MQRSIERACQLCRLVNLTRCSTYSDLVEIGSRLCFFSICRAKVITQKRNSSNAFRTPAKRRCNAIASSLFIAFPYKKAALTHDVSMSAAIATA